MTDENGTENALGVSSSAVVMPQVGELWVIQWGGGAEMVRIAHCKDGLVHWRGRWSGSVERVADFLAAHRCAMLLPTTRLERLWQRIARLCGHTASAHQRKPEPQVKRLTRTGRTNKVWQPRQKSPNPTRSEK